MSDTPPDWLPDANGLADLHGGAFHEESYTPVVYDVSKRQISKDGTAYFIGSAGADGIQFAFRRGFAGIWAHYPYDDAWRKVADDVAGLIDGWASGQISV